jgi:Xaa-Pro aminopeptidase
MEANEKLRLLRASMQEKAIDAYIIPSCDAHQSEYVAEHWRSRAWISGFTGSAGTVVVTMKESGLWTDGRYFIQATKELEGSEIQLFKMKQPGVPTFIEWIESILPEGACVGFDSRVLSRTETKKLEAQLKEKEMKINGDFDFMDAIWEERSQIPLDPIYIHDIQYAGKKIEEKLNLLRSHMKEKRAKYYIVSTLDDIAWLFNIRGNDEKNNPVATAYAMIGEEEAFLFIDSRKVIKEVAIYLQNNQVTLKEYDAIGEVLKKMKKEDAVYFDPDKTRLWLYQSIPTDCNKS